MKGKIVVTKLLAIAFLIILEANLSAQDTMAIQKALSLVQKNAKAIGISDEDIVNSRISDTYLDAVSGSTLVYLQQTQDGIDVDRVIQVFAFKNDTLVSAAGKRINLNTQQPVSAREKKAATPSVTVENAIGAAANYLKLPAPSFSFKSAPNRDYTKATDFGDMGIAKKNVTAKLLWMPRKGVERADLVWEVNLSPKKSPDNWRVMVDAKTGMVIKKENYTIYDNWLKIKKEKKTSEKQNDASEKGPEQDDNDNNYRNQAAQRITSAEYRVVRFPAESPISPNGAPALAADPWLLSPTGSGATSLLWNNDGSKEYKITRGNNVHAFSDPTGFGDPLINAKGVIKKHKLIFDFRPDFDKLPSDSINQRFSITNLFYWNNIMHDLSYQYGFDEVSGNFQQNNLGRGGQDGDFVIASAQDGFAENNAYFGADADGSPPYMYVGLFYDYRLQIHIKTPVSIAGNLEAVESQVSFHNLLKEIGPVTGNVALFNETEDTLHLACNAPNIDLKGKIALINRGSCDFTIKILNAQNAGAIAVIVANNVPGEASFIMGGDEPSITIPAVMISFEDGAKIRGALNTGSAINITLSPPLTIDIGLDNAVIRHEYTHGISARLVGGPSTGTCLFNDDNMDEGYSDYLALMSTTDWRKANKNDGSKPRPMGAYSFRETNGIRRYPYSTDMRINPHTYEDVVRGIEFHDVGEIWTSVLWDMTWNLIQTDGINKDIFNSKNIGGNTVAYKLVLLGMKLEPCAVGFIVGRDAILKADSLLYNGKHSCSIWNAFARRGMGLGAVQGDPDTVDFKLGAITIASRADKKSVSPGDKINYSIKLKANAVCDGRVPQNYKVVDSLPGNVSYVSSDGVYDAANRTVSFRNIDMNKGESLQFKLKVKVKGNASFPDSVYLNDLTDGPTISEKWVVKNGQSLSWERFDPEFSGYKSNDVTVKDDESLTTAEEYLVPGIKTTFSFYHSINTDEFNNGGVIEISTDKGKTWQDLGQYMDPANFIYTNTITGNSVLNGRKAFSGTQYGTTMIDVSRFSGKKVKFRFRYATSDNSSAFFGWYIRDIILSATPVITNMFRLTTQKNELKRTATIITGIQPKEAKDDFTAVKREDEALLNWSTNVENGSSMYQIERSTDNGATFKAIGSVNSVVNDDEDAAPNSFTDVSPKEGYNLYRLKQVATNGAIRYSEVRSLKFGGFKVKIFPNPAKDRITVFIPGNNKTTQLRLIDIWGRKIEVYQMSGQYAELKLPVLVRGIYYINVTLGSDVSNHKIMIE